jgi:FtsP/CotA-like multicopper oxidase with cupredoxin domain
VFARRLDGAPASTFKERDLSTPKRAGLLALAAVILVAAFVALRPSDKDPSPAAAAASTSTPTVAAADSTATPESTPTPRATPDPGPLLTKGSAKTIRVSKGDTVRFRVRSAESEEIHVHGYDIKRDLAPGKTVDVSFKATIDGIFEIELEHSTIQVAKLRVDP